MKPAPLNFDALMSPFASFEPQPHMAVAVSGGPDSMALALALHDWTQRHQGRLTAFHVDHRLRSESTTEALTVQTWLTELGIECHILTWDHPPLTSALMDRARTARYELLLAACRTQGILHLALGHHLGDDQETFHMRQEKKSGTTGLAGMSAIVETPHVRMIRPFLSLTKNELSTFLGDHPALEDPSNTNPRFTRGRLRTTDASVVTPDLGPYKQQRIREERLLVPLCVDYVTIHPEGYGTVSPALLTTASPLILLDIVRRLVRTIGSLAYLPSPGACEQILRHSRETTDFHQATLGNCTLTFSKSGLTVTRELRSIQPYPLTSTAAFLWDKRFFVAQIPQNALDLGMNLNYLGTKGFLETRSLYPSSMPTWVGLSLPALWRDHRVVQPLFTMKENAIPLHLRFQPKHPLLDAYFFDGESPEKRK